MSSASRLKPVPDSLSFPAEEKRVLGRWKEIKAFETQLERSKGKKEFTFYDGPPFATGLPHYGHLLAGTIKDVVTRWATQTGHYVERRFGWDTHGLPVEYEIDKKLNIQSRDDVLKMGIDKYNAECRGIVQRYSKEWQVTVERMGRWIDFDNDYKTLDPSFMESVWWVFKTLWEKDMVYRGFKVMPYSTACNTPLSNFESGLNYKDVSDPAVVVSFPLLDEPDTLLLAWTTTPWTLPSNLGLTVHPTMEYVKIKDTASGRVYVVAEARLDELYKKAKVGKEVKDERFTVLEKFPGEKLRDRRYKPLFPFFEQETTAFRVLVDTYVTADAGTGIVHSAPAFGEDDYRVCLANGVIQKGESIICPVDANGRFTEQVAPWAGVNVKEADKSIVEALKKAGRLIKAGSIVHSYPFCWRSDTPLIYRAVPSWFVHVEKIKEKLLHNNTQTYWVPAFVQERRFHMWLKDARDWAVSRNRFWGTPIPVWTNEAMSEFVVIGSIEELQQRTGVKVDDLHRDTIDKLTIKSKDGKSDLRRIDEVFDCWFESGSMPYAYQHYPFENKERFESGATFPADFVAEGLDQTRGWFYTLMVLSTALFDKPAFRNLIVNGMILASDGQKMSKSKKNYPDPNTVVEAHGADALRLYLVNSPAVRAEPLKFREDGVRDVVKDVFIPWSNAYRFFVQNVHRYEQRVGKEFARNESACQASTNTMDQWIFSCAHSLVKWVRQEMAAYRLYTVSPRLVAFIGQLTNWYVRMNRSRLKGDGNTDEDCVAGLATMLEVLLITCKTMAPFTPFLVDSMYSNLSALLPAAERLDSVHYEEIPQANTAAFKPDVERGVERLQTIVELGRRLRQDNKQSMRVPLAEVLVVVPDAEYAGDVTALQAYVASELNVRKVTVTEDRAKWVKMSVAPVQRTLGKRFGKRRKEFDAAIKALDEAAVESFLATGSVSVLGETLTEEEVLVQREFKGSDEHYKAEGDRAVVVVLDLRVSDDLRQEALARELCNRIQKLRKKAGLTIGDRVSAAYRTTSANAAFDAAVAAQVGFIRKQTNVTLVAEAHLPTGSSVIAREREIVSDTELTLSLVSVKAVVKADASPVLAKDADLAGAVAGLLAGMSLSQVQQQTSKDGTLALNVNNTDVVLTHGKDLFWGLDELPL